MSQPSRSKTRVPARRKRRAAVIEAVEWLEDRQLLAPVVSTAVPVATFTAATTPTNTDLGTVSISSVATDYSAAATTSVAELTSLNSFGGDMVRIEAGPGGAFGNAVYAISRGAGANSNSSFRDPSLQTPINRPGVIYRVDPATGKAGVFFDLNTVLNQLDPTASTGNGAVPSTGLTNWYDITFDPNGYFDGKPSMFVSSIDSSDPFKNVVYRIAPDGTFMGLYFTFNTVQSGVLNVQPSAIMVPPVNQQSFLRGMFVGQYSPNNSLPAPSTTSLTGNSDLSITTSPQTLPGNGNPVLFVDANSFVPGTDITGTNQTGVAVSPMTYGPAVGLTAANSIYASPDYTAFTNFGTPAGGGIQAQPGLSGVQGLRGELLIGNGLPEYYPIPQNDVATVTAAPTATTPSGVDTQGAIASTFRRFQDIAYDQNGYFSYGTGITAATTFGTLPTATTIPPVYAGSMFVTDLSTGLAVSVTPVAPLATNPIAVPIQGPGNIGVQQMPDGSIQAVVTNGNTTDGSNIGGRVLRVGPDGVVTPFAQGFHVSGDQGSTSFANSTLSITFSADGTTMYVSDMDGIWQFKTTTSLAGSTSGSLVGLNDLRSLGVPYDGSNLAVAVVDTGVDGSNPSFQGQVSQGKDMITNGPGNSDVSGTPAGHGTQIAGVINQFVPQSTIVPVNVFTATQGTAAPTVGGTTTQLIWNGLQYLSQNPYVNDPLRTNTVDRLVAANFGFGTASTYQTEVAAYKGQKQAVLSLKAQMQRLRKLGIQPVAAAGQLSTSVNAGTTTGSTTTGTNGDTNGMALPAILNEVISVSGVYPFPFATGPTSAPTDPVSGVYPQQPGPVLLSNGSGTTGGGGTNTTSQFGGNLAAITPDLLIFEDKILNAANRGPTTDFVAPAIDIPTYARTGVATTSSSTGGTTGTTTTTGTTVNVGGTGVLTFQQGGTSLSSAMVTGSFTMVASALDYWISLAHSGGVTSDAYLNVPVGTTTLNFGPTGIADLSSYLNPDSINAILQWTAVPATDAPNTLESINPQQLFPNAGGPYAQYSRIDVGNAIAAIEGTIALNYLLQHGDFDIIDSNHDGLVTAAELQTFEDNSAANGLAEAGAMARLLGGDARIPSTGFQNPAVAGTSPEQPDVLQRRYNFFDYAADGQLNGAISIQQYQMLAKTLLPSPDAFKVTNRTASAANGYLLSPNKDRNYVMLERLLPSQQTVPNNLVRRFAGMSPQRFGVNRGVNIGLGSTTTGTNTTTTSNYNDFTYTLFQGENSLSNARSKHTTTVTQPSTSSTSSSSTSTSSLSTSSTTPTSTSGTGSTVTTTTPVTTTPTTTSTSTTSTTQSGYSAQVLQALRMPSVALRRPRTRPDLCPRLPRQEPRPPAGATGQSPTSTSTSSSTDTTTSASTATPVPNSSSSTTPVPNTSSTVSTAVVTAPTTTTLTPAQTAQEQAKQATQAKYDQAQALRQARIAKEQAAIQASYNAQASQPKQKQSFLQKIFGSNGLFGWK